jgi:hypothetical protein
MCSISVSTLALLLLAFNDNTNLPVIATSVAEEGLDFPVRAQVKKHVDGLTCFHMILGMRSCYSI